MNLVACAPTTERCGARATHWRSDVPWLGPPRLCACCLKRWTDHGVGHLYHPIDPKLTRIMDLGCSAEVQR